VAEDEGQEVLQRLIVLKQSQDEPQHHAIGEQEPGRQQSTRQPPTNVPNETLMLFVMIHAAIGGRSSLLVSA